MNSGHRQALYLTCNTAIAKRYVVDIFATLRRHEYNPELMRLYIVGGGGLSGQKLRAMMKPV